MIPKALEIARLYLKTTFQDRSVLVFSVLLPLLFTFLIGQVRGGGAAGPTRWPVGVIDADGSTWSQALVEKLAEDASLEVLAFDSPAAMEALEAGELVAIIQVPTGFGTNLQEGKAVRIGIQPAAETVRLAQLVQRGVEAAVTRLEGALQVADFSVTVADRLGLFAHSGAPQREAYTAAAYDQADRLWESAPVVVVESVPITRLEDPQTVIADGLEQSSPGMMVMFAMFFVIGGGAALIQEREQGTLRRLVIMPLPRGSLMVGKFLGIFTSGLGQIAILVLAGGLLFGVPWGRSPAGLALLVVSFAFAITGLGMLMAAVVRTSAQANSLSTVVILAMAALGGAWWPLEVVPAWMQTLGHLFPTAWAMDGFHDLLTRGLGTPAVLPEAGLLLVYGLVFMAIAVWKMKYE